MNALEINSSFYKTLLPSTVKKWTLDVPDNFKFTFKLSKEITHRKNLDFKPELITQFFDVIPEAGNKKGCLLVQLPPSIRIQHLPLLNFLIQMLSKNDPERQWSITLEFRHPSLYISEIYELLNEYELEMDIHDICPSNSPIIDSNRDFVYLRFHGPNGNYRDNYADDVLAEYVSYISDWLTEGKRVFAYFNNTMRKPHENLSTLKDYVNNIHQRI